MKAPILCFCCGLLLAAAAWADVPEELAYAIRTGDGQGVTRLLENGAAVNGLDKHGLTPLMNAVDSDRPDMAELVLGSGADALAVSKHGVPTIIFAAERGNMKSLQLLVAAGADVNTRLGNETSAIRAAVWSGHLDAVKFLVANGANALNWSAMESNPVGEAAASGNPDLVAYVVSLGANVNVQDGCGRTPLIVAAENSMTRALKALIKARADPNIIGKDGADHPEEHTALSWAAEMGNTEAVKALIAAGADVHAINDAAIRNADLYGYPEIVKLLEGAGARLTPEGLAHPATWRSNGAQFTGAPAEAPSPEAGLFAFEKIPPLPAWRGNGAAGRCGWR